VLAYADEQRRRLDPRTPEGIYNLVLAQTGNTELAEQALTRAKEDLKLARMEGTRI
jgi:hypothetical protein